MSSITNHDIKKLQKNLSLIRRAGGWTPAEFGELLGVTDQTIRNLERNDPDKPMSKMQYIAIRSVLDYEMQSHPEKTALREVVQLLFYTDEGPETKKKTEMIETYVNTAKSQRQSDAAIAAGLVAFLGAIVSIGSGIGASLHSVPKVPEWLKSIMLSSKGKK